MFLFYKRRKKVANRICVQFTPVSPTTARLMLSSCRVHLWITCSERKREIPFQFLKSSRLIWRWEQPFYRITQSFVGRRTTEETKIIRCGGIKHQFCLLSSNDSLSLLLAAAPYFYAKESKKFSFFFLRKRILTYCGIQQCEPGSF